MFDVNRPTFSSRAFVFPTLTFSTSSSHNVIMDTWALLITTPNLPLKKVFRCFDDDNAYLWLFNSFHCSLINRRWQLLCVTILCATQLWVAILCATLLCATILRLAWLCVGQYFVRQYFEWQYFVVLVKYKQQVHVHELQCCSVCCAAEYITLLNRNAGWQHCFIKRCAMLYSVYNVSCIVQCIIEMLVDNIALSVSFAAAA